MSVLEYYELAMQTLYALRDALSAHSVRLRICRLHVIAHFNDIKRIVHSPRAPVLPIPH